MTGGDGTAYYGEEAIDEKVMTKKDIKKRDEIADAISDKEMKDRYGCLLYTSPSPRD